MKNNHCTPYDAEIQEYLLDGAATFYQKQMEQIQKRMIGLLAKNPQSKEEHIQDYHKNGQYFDHIYRHRRRTILFDPTQN